jgi:hypothetical protein
LVGTLASTKGFKYLAHSQALESSTYYKGTVTTAQSKRGNRLALLLSLNKSRWAPIRTQVKD